MLDIQAIYAGCFILVVAGMSGAVILMRDAEPDSFLDRHSRLQFNGVAICALAMLASIVGFVSTLFTVSAGDGSVEEVVESRPLAAFEQEDSEVTGASATGLSFILFNSASVEVDKSDGEYVVMEDERGDGGLARKSYPVDEVRVYEDADASTARVEEVEIMSEPVEGTFLGIWPVTGYLDSEEETRIHVPEGTLDMARLSQGTPSADRM